MIKEKLFLMKSLEDKGDIRKDQKLFLYILKTLANCEIINATDCNILIIKIF